MPDDPHSEAVLPVVEAAASRVGRPAAPAGRRTVGRRYLHRGHFAFFRALLEGVELGAVWDRYLSVEGEHTDLRLVPATLAWMRAEFAAAAKREDRPGTARLLRLDVQRLVEAPLGLPSLAQFAEEAGLEDECERDQIEAYQARYGRASARQRRRAQLLQRQLAALRWLEEVVAREPAAGDAIGAWLRPEIANFLGAADLFTLGQLAERINGIGLNWARSIRGIGPLKSRRITAWMREHQASIGMPIGVHVELPRHQLARATLESVLAPAADVRPLEKLVVPSELDGRTGAFRRPQSHCLLEADNDYDAILSWLRAKRGPAPTQRVASARVAPGHESRGQGGLGDLSHTQRSYRKEAERFLLWAIVERRKPVSSMTVEDCVAYREFLADPIPRSRWCGPRARERWSPLWRPFEGPLSPAAQRQAITILTNLYAFLVDQNYVMGNPWAAVAIPRAGKASLDSSRSLTRDQWALVLKQAGQGGDHSTAVRLRLALRLLYGTGLRLGEAVRAKLGDLQAVEYFDADTNDKVRGWVLRVMGKGTRLREVPLADEIVDDLRQYLVHRGLQAELKTTDTQDVYFLSVAVDVADRLGALAGAEMSDPVGPISEATLYRQLKRHFQRCAEELRAAGDSIGAAKLDRASTHWLRHTHASHALASGVRVQEVQQNLGHASLATTTAYVTTERAQRLRSMQDFWSKANSR